MEELECYYDIILNDVLLDTQCIVISFLQLVFDDFKKIKTFYMLYRLSHLLSKPMSDIILVKSLYNDRYIKIDNYTTIRLVEKVYNRKTILDFNAFDIQRINNKIIPTVIKCLLNYIDETSEKIELELLEIEKDVLYQTSIAYFLIYIEKNFRSQETFAEVLREYI